MFEISSSGLRFVLCNVQEGAVFRLAFL